MASQVIFDPLAALALALLVSSTCTLWYAFDQHHFLTVFNSPVNRTKSDAILPTYFKEFFQAGLPRVVGLLGLTFLTAIGNYYWRYDSLVATRSLRWYVAGAWLAVSHLLFVPLVAPRIQSIVENRAAKGRPTSVLDEWLNIHLFRTWTVDLAAWTCFVVGVVRNVNV
ncbi:hypothetical protein UA08_03083 [Talaromyces atroroseus]|uniref:Integral membrane protein n=1 Tax=Talaromyces atroroseus TaxID=1441469 RepID=A0A225B3P2_TALAT|nr:hypothetical protein UA08_03083 [Talaromyces atroroseus]OKL61455.1 hypothetical protein UA08_03083 [Talaromyces atroroseus]